MDTLQRYSAQLREAKNPRTVVELCLISLCDNTLGENINALRARVSRLVAAAAGQLPAADVSAPMQSAPADALNGQLLSVPPAVQEMRTPPNIHPLQPAPERIRIEPECEQAIRPDMQEHIDTAPVERASVPAVDDAPALAVGDTRLWNLVCEAVAPKLAPDLRYTLGDTAKIRGMADGNTLKIECLPGFVYGRFNRQDVLERFSQAARNIAGREIRVTLSELSDSGEKTRSVEELRQFKEVRFI